MQKKKKKESTHTETTCNVLLSFKQKRYFWLAVYYGWLAVELKQNKIYNSALCLNYKIVFNINITGTLMSNLFKF